MIRRMTKKTKNKQTNKQKPPTETMIKRMMETYRHYDQQKKKKKK